MIGAFNQHELFRFLKRSHQSLDLLARAKRIACAADKQFSFGAILQEFQFVNARLFRVGGDRNRRNSHANQPLHSRIGASSPQPDRCTEGEPRKQQRQVKLRGQPVESGSNILDFAVAVVVLALAESGPAEVEAQHGKTKTVQRLHGMEYDLVMQRSAKQRMRMANYRRVGCVLRACVEQGFESSCRTFEEERSDG